MSYHDFQTLLVHLREGLASGSISFNGTLLVRVCAPDQKYYEISNNERELLVEQIDEPE